MDYALDHFRQQIEATIAATGKIPPDAIELVVPKPNIPADLSFPTFRTAKELGVSPPQLAQELAVLVQFPPDSLVGRVAAVGPYLNFSLHPERFIAAVLREIERGRAQYGFDDQGSGQTVLVEYSSPNMARRMHVGHIRSTIIGLSLLRIFQALGYATIGDNHIGDWGTNFGILITAIQHEGRPAGTDESALARLEQLYAQYNKLTETDESIAQEARDWSLKLEQGEPQARELWRWIVDLTLAVNKPLYERLDVQFDTVHGESFYEDKMEEVIEQALAQGVAHHDAGNAVVVELPKLPTFLLRRSDGGTLYHTRDLATVVFREREYHPAKNIYVVDARQSLHFQQLFALAQAMGYAQQTELVHVSFGTIFGPDGQPLAARKGNMIYLQQLLDQAHERALAIVERTNADLPAEEKETVAEAVGIGAVIYNDLYQDPKRNITLDWDRMLALEGNSAPYIQYMYARCCSILSRAAEEGAQAGSSDEAQDATVLQHESERDLARQLAKLPPVVREAGARFAPFVIAEWCYETARALANFYRDCPVLKAETPELRRARLRLVAATARALQNGLWLLGIRVVARM
jgi:arginyl-tRNA synthetase